MSGKELLAFLTFLLSGAAALFTDKQLFRHYICMQTGFEGGGGDR